MSERVIRIDPETMRKLEERIRHHCRTGSGAWDWNELQFAVFDVSTPYVERRQGERRKTKFTEAQ